MLRDGVGDLGAERVDLLLGRTRVGRQRFEASLLKYTVALDALATDPSPEADLRRAEVHATMETKVAAMNALQADLALGPLVVTEWAGAVGEELAPTRYGRGDPNEGFAEAFALFHADPEALRRAAPRSSAWFAAGGHLTAIRAAFAHVDALAAPGFAAQ